MEPTGIEPVTSCLQNIWARARFPHHMRTSAEKSAWGTDLSQRFRTWYGPNLERKHGEVTPAGHSGTLPVNNSQSMGELCPILAAWFTALQSCSRK